MRFPGWYISLVLVLVAGCGGAVDPALYAKFQAAQDAFEQSTSPEQFLRAAALYQEILDSGVISGAVLYNQGNAFMRAGQRGRAVACYRQASRYRPRDPYLQANLRNALPGDAFGARKPLVEYVLFWQDWISYSSKFTVSTALALLTFILAVGSLFRWPTGLKRGALAALLVTLALAVSAVYDWHRFTQVKHGVIVRNEVVARKGDGKSYQPAFTEPLAEATEFVVADRRNGWVLARLGAGQEGWVPVDAVVIY
jgi:tetratricopeptide (TPR) repeat protein